MSPSVGDHRLVSYLSIVAQPGIDGLTNRGDQMLHQWDTELLPHPKRPSWISSV